MPVDGGPNSRVRSFGLQQGQNASVRQTLLGDTLVFPFGIEHICKGFPVSPLPISNQLNPFFQQV